MTELLSIFTTEPEVSSVLITAGKRAKEELAGIATDKPKSKASRRKNKLSLTEAVVKLYYNFERHPEQREVLFSAGVFASLFQQIDGMTMTLELFQDVAKSEGVISKMAFIATYKFGFLMATVKKWREKYYPGKKNTFRWTDLARVLTGRSKTHCDLALALFQIVNEYPLLLLSNDLDATCFVTKEQRDEILAVCSDSIEYKRSVFTQCVYAGQTIDTRVEKIKLGNWAADEKIEDISEMIVVQEFIHNKRLEWKPVHPMIEDV